MSTFNFKPVHITGYLTEGKYTGAIKNIQFFEDKGYFVFNILTDSNITFNTTFAAKNKVFNEFVTSYVDTEGNFVDDDLIDQRVVFAVADGSEDTNGNIRSRIVMIKSI